jgi:hypothetical protein
LKRIGFLFFNWSISPSIFKNQSANQSRGRNLARSSALSWNEPPAISPLSWMGPKYFEHINSRSSRLID